ncbi:hypothetical protein DH2020_029888 [Rehmannia glutinosa]|uniref:Plastocyanin-like domain-containing protein n=1 Tax=Rehmannia glutinosa TaxID=99300 RepID=A0ABR0VM82_REHGL
MARMVREMERCAHVHYDPGKTYRYRFCNVGMKNSINVRIQGHTMKLVEIEGSHTVQNVYDSLDVHLGQCYSVLVTTDQTPKDYYLVASTTVHKDGVDLHRHHPIEPGRWTPEKRKNYNLIDAVSRHTIHVYPKSWAAIMTTLDNAGMWNLRALVLERQYLGQQLYISVLSPERSFATNTTC